MYSMLYYGLFRVGEITKGEHPILARNVHLAQNKKKLLIYLESSKMHNKGNNLQIVKISAVDAGKKEKNPKNDKFCPFRLIRDFLQVRSGYKSLNETFFIFRNIDLV